jgi:hypothetical protein
LFKKIAVEIAAKPRFYAALLIARLIVSSLTWRDLRLRTAEEVRGCKHLWRLLSSLNTSNSLVYFVFGLKRTH